VNNELIELAKKLMPKGVFLRSCSFESSDQLSQEIAHSAFQVESKSRPGSYLDYIELGEGDGPQQLIGFPFILGTRVIEDSKEENDDSSEVKVEINANFVAEYYLLEETKNISEFMEENKVVLENFHNRNVVHHVWPYWRELVQSLCSRAGIPIIPIPHHFHGKPAAKKKG